MICSDKTGTLTSNEMTVRHVLLVSSTSEGSTALRVEGNGWSPIGSISPVAQAETHGFSLQSMSRVSSLCNNAQLEFDGATYRKIGESTEAALKVGFCAMFS